MSQFVISPRGKCVYFNGSQNGTCDAGVNYHQAFGPEAGTSCRAPCIQEFKTHVRDSSGKMVPVWKPWPRNGHKVMDCPKFRLPTKEEIAASDAERQALMDRMRKVMEVVKPWRAGWSKSNRVGKAEVIKCPACAGRLHLSQAASNGHVWGKCETEGCVSWME